jgi:hypothetical protein
MLKEKRNVSGVQPEAAPGERAQGGHGAETFHLIGGCRVCLIEVQSNHDLCQMFSHQAVCLL